MRIVLIKATVSKEGRHRIKRITSRSGGGNTGDGSLC